MNSIENITKIDAIDVLLTWTDEYGAIYSEDKSRLLKGADVPIYVIPEGTKVICNDAFSDCKSLQHIYLPKSIEAIGSAAFYYCESLSEIDMSDINVTSVAPFSFFHCVRLSKITFSENTQCIGNNAFQYCKSLHYVNLPKRLTTIGAEAFRNTGIEVVSIYSDVSEIEFSAFGECQRLVYFQIPPKVTDLSAGLFGGCTQLSIIEMPDNLRFIDEGVFDHCEMLKDVKLPSNLETIGEYSFCGCTNLEKIVIPSKVNWVGNQAFSGCKKLKIITIQGRIESFSMNIIKGCDALKSIIIPFETKSSYKGWIKPDLLLENFPASVPPKLQQQIDNVPKDYFYIGFDKIDLNSHVLYALYNMSNFEEVDPDDFSFDEKNIIGLCFFNAHIVEKNYETALLWYKLSALSGSSKAERNMGICYEYGYGVEKDYIEAVRWYSKSANHGNANSQLKLASCFLTGKGVVKDIDMAHFWMEKVKVSAIEQKDLDVINHLGDLYRTGDKLIGAIVDTDLAAYYYKLASNLGHPLAKLNLAYMIRTGTIPGTYEDIDILLNSAISAQHGDNMEKFENAVKIEMIENLRKRLPPLTDNSQSLPLSTYLT